MATYRKKTYIFDPIQLTENNVREVYERINGPVILNCKMAEDKWDEYVDSVRKEGLKLKTLESDNETQTASIGDWIIQGAQGEFYPCKPDIFEKTYEIVE